MLDYAKFIESIKQDTDEYEQWAHVLPAVPETQRERFLKIITMGLNIPKAYDLIIITKDLTEEEFDKEIKSLKDKNS